MAMDGTWRGEVENLLTVSYTFPDQLRSQTITTDDAWYAFTSSYLKTLEYPLPAVSLSQSDWDVILQPVIGILLQKCGIASTWTRKLLFASAKYQGLGIKHPYYHQRIIHLQLLATHSLRTTPTSRLLQATTEEL